MNTLNAIFSFLNFLQLRRIRQLLTPPQVVTIQQVPGLLEGPYERGRIQEPPPEPKFAGTPWYVDDDGTIHFL
jgi:hypothetical protein